ncbi:MAG: nucleotidyl transferase AbiEii/AbiGii toxin family protein [Bacteroidaceae bacterium]|nr:nucleotidyl transferase AbiEii/AbiGii toxin family protein [Bacteroidaceae bacterium]
MISFNKSYLDRIATEKGFIRDNLEKVMRLAEILKHFHDNDLLAHSLVLKGGTAINLTVFQMPRLSVDIDLDFARNCSREEMLGTRTAINEYVLRYMESEGYRLKPGSKSPHALDSWIFGYTNAGGNADTIKIEINYSDRCHVLPVVERNITIDFLGDITVSVLSPIELFASKINALVGRCAMRDVYDVYNMLRTELFTEEDFNMLRKVLVFYLAVGSNCKAEDVPDKFPSFPLIDSITFSHVRAQLLPVLSNKDKFDYILAKQEVRQFLEVFLLFGEKEHEFIRLFRQRIYSPEVLFGEGDITNRVRSHPMALWKCRPQND